MFFYFSASRPDLFDQFERSTGAKSHALQRIREFTERGEGWHYGEGGAPSHSVAAYAAHLVHYFYSLGFRRIKTFCGTKGEIIVATYYAGNCIESIVERDLTFSLTHEQKKNGQWFDVEEDDCLNWVQAKGWIRKVAQKIWNSYASSTPTILTKSEDVSSAQNFKTRPMGAFQLFTGNASKTAA